jgi:hypothetical protein
MLRYIFHLFPVTKHISQRRKGESYSTVQPQHPRLGGCVVFWGEEKGRMGQDSGGSRSSWAHGAPRRPGPAVSGHEGIGSSEVLFRCQCGGSRFCPLPDGKNNCVASLCFTAGGVVIVAWRPLVSGRWREDIRHG